MRSGPNLARCNKTNRSEEQIWCFYICSDALLYTDQKLCMVNTCASRKRVGLKFFLGRRAADRPSTSAKYSSRRRRSAHTYPRSQVSLPRCVCPLRRHAHPNMSSTPVSSLLYNTTIDDQNTALQFTGPWAKLTDNTTGWQNDTLTYCGGSGNTSSVGEACEMRLTVNSSVPRTSFYASANASTDSFFARAQDLVRRQWPRRHATGRL